MKPDNIPSASGVYLMKDSSGKIIYIGKAKNLKKRLQSYFDKSYLNKRIANLVSKIDTVDWIITKNETEAFILENNLIKLHKPYYNIQLKDDKTYPYIKITVTNEFPGIYITRKYENDGSLYFGPYTNVAAARKLLGLLKRTFKIRTCGNKLPSKACLDYHINLCSAPCIGKIDQNTYNIAVKSAVKFLRGDITRAILFLERDMKRYAKKMQYEKAALIRDTINSINHLREHQHVMLNNGKTADFISVQYNGAIALAGVFRLRNGAIIGKEIYHISNPLEEGADAILRHFILQYINISFQLPPIIKTKRLNQLKTLNKTIEKLGKKVTIKSIYGDDERSLMKMLDENILFESDKEEQKKIYRKSVTVEALKNALNLSFIPDYIVCFDISHLYGNYSVGSAVVFHNGKPLKRMYRRFKIKKTKGINDFEMIKEVVERYFSHKESRKINLVMVDGGAIQLRMAREALKIKKVTTPVIALAKRLEEIYVDEKSIISLQKTSPALKLLQQIRDEAHRFAINYNRYLRKNDFKLILEEVNGVGKKRALQILSAFGSLENIRRATVKQLMAIPGINKKIAKEIKDLL